MGVRIGFEIHVQLKSKTKLFCECSCDYEKFEPNTNICPICTGQPGSKPMYPSEEVFVSLLKVGRVLGCKVVRKEVRFLRKHYFYPDLPKNYQITSEPVMISGNFFGVRIKEVHLEEDPGRYDLRNGYVDFNRSGVPLAEIVTHPDIDSADFARKWLERLILYLKYTKAIVEKPGSLRVDINISIERGKRVEVKNVSSISGVYRAIKYEEIRQKRAICSGLEIRSETRHYDENKKITLPLREKEGFLDYRYFPDPDLPPFKISRELIKKAYRGLSSPSEIENILSRKGVKKEYIDKVLRNPDVAKKIVEAIKYIDGNLLCELITNNLSNLEKKILLEFLSRKELVLDIVSMVKNREIPRGEVKRIVENCIRFGKKPRDIYFSEGIGLREIEEVVEKVLSENEKAVIDYLSGKERAIHYLVGEVTRNLSKKVDGKVILEMIKRKISYKK